MKRITLTVFITLFILLGIAGCEDNIHDATTPTTSAAVSETSFAESPSEFIDDKSDNVPEKSTESEYSQTQPIASGSESSETIHSESDESSTSEEAFQQSSKEETGKKDENPSIPQAPIEEDTGELSTAGSDPEELHPEASTPSNESAEESSVPETYKTETSAPEPSEENKEEASIPESSDLPQPDASDIFDEIEPDESESEASESSEVSEEDSFIPEPNEDESSAPESSEGNETSLPEESTLPEGASSTDTSEPDDVLLTEQDHNRIMSEVISYAESYSDKGFVFDRNESMTFGWDVGFMGTPRVKYDGVDGVIKMLKHHIDLIYQTSTDPMYGLTTNYMTYKIEQVIVDGDLAYVVIYGG